MRIRLGFVSNSSSSSFVIPKKYLTEEDLQILDNHRYKDGDTEIHDSEHYMYGTFSMHNICLAKLFKKYSGKDGVDYQCSD